MRIVFWGIGNTAKEVLYKIKEFSNQIEVVAFTDKCQDNVKEDSTWEDYKLIAPQKLHLLNIEYICILSIWEEDIRKRIYQEKLFDLSRIINFHEVCMVNLFGVNIEESYDKFMQSVQPRQLNYTRKWRCYEYLKRNYSYILYDNQLWGGKVIEKINIKKEIRPVWVLWLQGIEQAPEVVKVCVYSIKKKLGKQEEIYLLDENNMFDYIDVPNHIIRKWKDGTISNAHFSDFVRVRLLNTYGGIWIDATVYFTGRELPRYLKNGNLFMYSCCVNWRECNEPRIAANWLISSQPKNKLLLIMERFLDEYWKKEDSAINYFFFHIYWTLIAEQFPDEWDQVENILRDPTLLLHFELPHKFDCTRFEQIKEISDIHKLSYRGVYGKKEENNLWAKICQIEGADGLNTFEIY